MRINYPKTIQESEEDLTELEQRLRGQKAADRARMLRLLKSGTVKSLKDCAPLLGYSVIQLTRWWERYRTEGLAPNSLPRRGKACCRRCERDILQPCKMRVIIWSASGGFGTRMANRCGGSSRNIGSSGRPGGDAIRKPMPSNRPPLKKLREPDQTPTAQAHRGFR